MISLVSMNHIINQAPLENSQNTETQWRKYHHSVEDIQIISDGFRMETLAMHKPTINLRIKICDEFTDFDEKYNPYTAYVLRICDSGCVWTIKTRFSKLYAFHSSLKYDPSIRNQDCLKGLQFPRKSVIGVINDGFLKKRRRKLNRYFKSLSEDILISDIMRQFVTPQNFVFCRNNLISDTCTSINSLWIQNL